ncbi:MAG TPA: hypothetical protein VKT78_01875 [Fimbriimonadaceae bacterium]|nr:hypothetical protein [Fimbriimonadaceae bacterium]
MAPDFAVVSARAWKLAEISRWLNADRWLEAPGVADSNPSDLERRALRASLEATLTSIEEMRSATAELSASYMEVARSISDAVSAMEVWSTAVNEIPASSIEETGGKGDGFSDPEGAD